MNLASHLRSARLLLRPVFARDIWPVCRLLRNADVRRYLGGPVEWTSLYPRFRQYRAGAPDTDIWMVVWVERRRAIGLVELGPHKDGRDYEVSYQFLPSAWGHGLAREAVAVVLKNALSSAGLSKVIAETQSANTASCRLLRSLGMVEQKRVERYGAEQIIFSTR